MSDKIAKSRHLSVLSYAQGFTAWHYKMPMDDHPRMLETPEYWENVVDMIEPGDIISVTNSEFAAQVVVFLKGSKKVFRTLSSVKL